MTSITIDAILDKELEVYLKRIGLWEEFREGKLRCFVCGRVLTVENFGGVYEKGEEKKPFCNDPACYLQVLKMRK